jgi:nitrate reductase gamma subunit
MLSVIHFEWQNFQDTRFQIPTDGMLLIHLAAVILLMIVFPFSKLLHAPGVFFSPGRNQVDNAREKRHVAPWAIKQFEAQQG